jgi:transcriptional regulator with XRE-family HTH domain
VGIRAARGLRSSPAMAFGRALAVERRRQCKSMSLLANIAGTHASEVSRLERGLRDPRLSTMVRLAVALEVPLGVFVAGLGGSATELASLRTFGRGVGQLPSAPGRFGGSGGGGRS